MKQSQHDSLVVPNFCRPHHPVLRQNLSPDWGKIGKATIVFLIVVFAVVGVTGYVLARRAEKAPVSGLTPLQKAGFSQPAPQERLYWEAPGYNPKHDKRLEYAPDDR